MSDNTYARCEKFYEALETFEQNASHTLSRDLLPMTRPIAKKTNLQNVASAVKILMRRAGELYITGDCIEGVVLRCKGPVKNDDGEPRLQFDILSRHGTGSYLFNPNHTWSYRNNPTQSAYILVDCESKIDGRPRIPLHILAIEGSAIIASSLRQTLVERVLLLEGMRHVWRRRKQFE